MGSEFHTYLKQLRSRYIDDTRKLCLILKQPHALWSKIERGINPPPKPSVLKQFARVVQTKNHEEVELIALARRWKPSPLMNRPHELLMPPAESISVLGDAEFNRRVEAAYEANRPDYPHKYFKPIPSTAQTEILRE